MAGLRGTSSIRKAYNEYTEEKKENNSVKDIPLESIIPYHRECINGQPIFRDYDDEHIEELAESLHTHGQMKTITVFPSGIEKGKYEVLEGKQRTRASLFNLTKYDDAPKTIRAEVLDFEKVAENDYQYGDLMYVNTNIYRREELLPSELGLAFEMQASAMSHQGANTGAKQMLLEISENSNTSVSRIRTIRRIIPKHCIKELIDLVDKKFLPVSSTSLYLTYMGEVTNKKNQKTLYEFVYNHCNRNEVETQIFFKNHIKTEDMKRIKELATGNEEQILTASDLEFLCKKQQPKRQPTTFRTPSKKVLQEIIPAELWGDSKASAAYLIKAKKALEEIEKYKEKFGEL